MSTIVVGTVALDTIIAPKGKRERVLGGSALHFSNAASKLGSVNLVGITGGDFPQIGFDFFREKKVSTEGLKVVKDGKSFFWVGEYSASNMNEAITHETHLNVLEQFNPIIPQEYLPADFLFLANIDPTLQDNVLQQVKPNRLVFLDTMNYWIHSQLDTVKKVIAKVDGIVLNEQEIRDLTQIHHVLDAAQTILEWGPTYIIIKKGEYGVALVSKDNYFVIPAFPVKEVIDPTGAGDSFAGGFVSYLDFKKNTDWKTFQEALCYATIVASFNVEGYSIEGLEPVSTQHILDRYRTYQKYSGIGIDLKLS